MYVVSSYERSNRTNARKNCQKKYKEIKNCRRIQLSINCILIAQVINPIMSFIPEKFNQEFALFFFNKGQDIVLDGGKIKNFYNCKSDTVVGRKCISQHNAFSVTKSAGYTNLKSHLVQCIPEYETKYAARASRDGNSSSQNVVDRISSNLYGWINLVVTGDLPFSYVSRPLVRQHSRLNSISPITLLKYLDQLGFECEGVLIGVLPDRFGLLFDGWDDGYYIGTFVNWYDEKKQKVVTYLLRLTPSLRNDDFVDSHVEIISGFLNDVDKSWDNVVVIMGANTPNNVAIAHRSHKPFLGCYANRLELGVVEQIKAIESLLNKVNTLAVALLSKKRVGQLRRDSSLKQPLRRTKGSWAGTYSMLESYFQYRPFLNTGTWVTNEDIVDLLPTSDENIQLQVYDINALQF